MGHPMIICLYAYNAVFSDECDMNQFWYLCYLFLQCVTCLWYLYHIYIINIYTQFFEQEKIMQFNNGTTTSKHGTGMRSTTWIILFCWWNKTYQFTEGFSESVHMTRFMLMLCVISLNQTWQKYHFHTFFIYTFLALYPSVPQKTNINYKPWPQGSSSLQF